jgi:hypothetical protein
MEILGFEPKITICKIAVLPIKLYPLEFLHKPISEKRLERLRLTSINLKIILSTNSSTRIICVKARMIRTLI